MDNENSMLQRARYTELSGWHQYDFLIKGTYGWGYCLSSAIDLANKDLEMISTVAVADSAGGPGTEHIEDVKRAGGIARCQELKPEKAVIAVGGNSHRLECQVKVIWYNNSSFIQIFTSEPKHDYILFYIEQMIRHFFGNLAFNPYSLKGIPEIEIAEAVKKVDVNSDKSETGGADEEKPSVEGNQETVEPVNAAEINDESDSVSVDEEEEEEPIWEALEPESEAEFCGYIVVLKNLMNRPYMDIRGLVKIYKNEAEAKKAASELQVYYADIVKISMSEVQNELANWIKWGVQLICIAEGDNEESIDIAALSEGMLETTYMGASVSRFVGLMLQCENATFSDEIDNQWKQYSSILANIWNNSTPLMVPISYDGEPLDIQTVDTRVMLTDGAGQMIIRMNEIAKNASIYGFEDYFGSKQHIIVVDDHEKKSPLILTQKGLEEMSQLQQQQGIMHPRVVDNPMLHKSMLPVFTNLYDLEAIFGHTHVALFSAKELIGPVSETDGLVIDPGVGGLNYMMSAELFEALVSQ